MLGQQNKKQCHGKNAIILLQIILITSDIFGKVKGGFGQKNINNQKRSIKLTKIIDIFLSKYQSNLIPIGPSHGDFTNFNTLKTSDKKRYVFDLEFFQEVRPFLYDYFHWHIGPLLYNIMKYGITIKLNNNILYILITI